MSIPQSASLTACGPGRTPGMLPALAANSPPGCLFNASRPLRLTKCRRKAAVARLHAPAGAVHKGAFPNLIRNTKIRPMLVTIGRILLFDVIYAPYNVRGESFLSDSLGRMICRKSAFYLLSRSILSNKPGGSGRKLPLSQPVR